MGVSRLSKTRVAAKRVSINLVVESKTIGTKIPYRLSTVNVSKSGLLLARDDLRVPFSVNTILELTIDPTGTFLKEPVRCMAKVVRMESSNNNGIVVHERFGVQIIQLENEDASLWENCVGALEKSLAPIHFAA